MEGSITNNTGFIADKYGVPEKFVKFKIEEARKTGAYKAFAFEADRAKKSKNYVAFSDVISRAQKFEYDYVIGEIEKIAKERHTANELLSGMPEEDGYKADCAIHRLIFALDYVETCSIDLVEMIRKYYPDVSIKNFETIFKLKEEAKSVMSGIHSNATEYGAYLFADLADEIGDFVDRKVKEYLKKIKKHHDKASKK